VRAQLASAEAACGSLAQGDDEPRRAGAARVGPQQLEQIAQALATRPATAMILLTPDSSPGTLLGAMRAGVREVVPLPLANGEFRQAWARQVARLLLQRTPQPRAPAPVTAFIPAKGGAGATFLATGLAHALAARGQRVALIDLNLHAGDAALFLSDQAAAMTLAELAAQAARLDGALLESAMLACGPGCTCWPLRVTWRRWWGCARRPWRASWSWPPRASTTWCWTCRACPTRSCCARSTRPAACAW
jgi:Flp pilus assembly CpaE family ATPase